jgi:cold-inducible RNA-binding protein
MKKVYVGNLSFQAVEEDVKEAFATVGTVESVKIITDRETGKSKGFGFVEMASPEEANKAVDELSGKEIKGRVVKVSIARPKPDNGFQQR